MFSRRAVVRRGPGLLGTVALGTAGPTRGRRADRRQAPPPAQDETVSRLEQLAELHRSGALSDEEFGRAKRRVLGGG